MQEVLQPYSERVYDIQPERVAGTAQPFRYVYGKDGRPILTRQPKLLLNNHEAGKIENFYLPYGRRPLAAFGNSSSDDRQILEYTTVCLWSCARAARNDGRHLQPGALRRGHQERLDSDQHEERLEADLFI